MDYYKIGQKVRKYRKALNMSQERLAEFANISVTHMSHIETGNTKLSLSVLVGLATALDVRTDDLLFDKPPEKDISIKEVREALEGCSPRDAKIIAETVKNLKISLNKHL